nr:MAG: hypothetical protein J07AB56_05640 [Candidatus Nanosalinarum sp. J07AB56]
MNLLWVAPGYTREESEVWRTLLSRCICGESRTAFSSSDSSR